MAIFPNVCLWRRRYAQNWEVLTLKNCYSIEPPSYASSVYVVASYDPCFFSTVRFVKIRATCENFLGKWLTAPPPPLAKNFPYAYVVLSMSLIGFHGFLLFLTSSFQLNSVYIFNVNGKMILKQNKKGRVYQTRGVYLREGSSISHHLKRDTVCIYGIYTKLCVPVKHRANKYFKVPYIPW